MLGETKLGEERSERTEEFEEFLLEAMLLAANVIRGTFLIAECAAFGSWKRFFLLWEEEGSRWWFLLVGFALQPLEGLGFPLVPCLFGTLFPMSC